MLGTACHLSTWFGGSLVADKVHSHHGREKICFFMNNGTEAPTIYKLVLVIEVMEPS